MTIDRSLVLFNYDWDASAYAVLKNRYPHDTAGFDLFSFPSNVHLAWFDMERFTERMARRAMRRGYRAVVSNHEQFGALAAALLAERMSWPGTPVKAVLACQHKLHARQVLDRVCPEANLAFAPLEARYGDPIPDGLTYPLFIKPVKAAFSVLARSVANRDELQAHTRFGAWELWVIRHLVDPFERIASKRMSGVPSAHCMMIEEPMHGRQYNLDGYVREGALHEVGFVDSIMYPGTQSFMRFDYPSRLPPLARIQALDVARRFLAEVGFSHGMFNMEFFYDAASGRLTVIEFNPRLASQFSDLYRRVDGVDLHEMTFALAHGRDPASLPRAAATADAAASFVYRTFDQRVAPAMPGRAARARLHAQFPDALLYTYPKQEDQTARDFKWLGSHRYGIMHLGGRGPEDLHRRCERASALLGWTPPYADYHNQLGAAISAPGNLVAIADET